MQFLKYQEAQNMQNLKYKNTKNMQYLTNKSYENIHSLNNSSLYLAYLNEYFLWLLARKTDNLLS